MKVFIAIHFILSNAFDAAHKFWYGMFSFPLSQDII